jgi:hypothetical protein
LPTYIHIDYALMLDVYDEGLRPTNVRYEPAVYAVSPPGVTKDGTCLAMTRALGDFYAHPVCHCSSLSLASLKEHRLIHD